MANSASIYILHAGTLFKPTWTPNANNRLEISFHTPHDFSFADRYVTWRRSESLIDSLWLATRRWNMKLYFANQISLAHEVTFYHVVFTLIYPSNEGFLLTWSSLLFSSYLDLLMRLDGSYLVTNASLLSLCISCLNKTLLGLPINGFGKPR
jgi:hypothetical protein